MSAININYDYLIFFSIIPIVGFYLQKVKRTKIIFITVAICISFLIPTLFGYRFKFLICNYIAIFFIFSSLYALITILFMEKIWFKILSFLLSICLFFIIGFYGLLDAFSGYTRIEYTKSKGNYQIRYLKSQGWAGSGHLKIYELHHQFLYGLYTKKLESHAISSFDTNDICAFNFEKGNITYDRCKNELILPY